MQCSEEFKREIIKEAHFQDLLKTKVKLSIELKEAEQKAWKALSGYKFVMFGYWVGVWVHLNRISGSNKPNPWKKLVKLAKQEVESWKKEN